MSPKRPDVPDSRSQADEKLALRPYRRPRLEEYGSLRELTRTLSFDLPGDILATSFVS